MVPEDVAISVAVRSTQLCNYGHAKQFIFHNIAALGLLRHVPTQMSAYLTGTCLILSNSSLTVLKLQTVGNLSMSKDLESFSV